MPTFEKVKDLFSKKIKNDNLNLNSELRELGLDSLDLVELMMDLEKEFKIEFENDEITSFKLIGDVVNSIDSKIK